MDDWNLDEKSLDKWQLQHCESMMPQIIYNESQIMLGEHLVLVTLHCGLRLVSSKKMRIGDTKYHI